jgi:membrane protease YdiL (CAAX protease family)
MPKGLSAVLECVWTGVFAVLFTAIISGIWTGLLIGNLMTTPALPWCLIAMALVLWGALSFLGGQWGFPSTKAARAAYLRAPPLPAATMAWGIAAGVLWIIALTGFWIVLHQFVRVQGNPLPDFSKYPLVTVLAVLAMASISGGLSEEAGFRGYFQGTLERRGLGWGAVLVTMLVMAPEHALSQGFVWPNVLFYLLVDGMLGALAYLTKSIRPGAVVHAIGLFVFFAFVWPRDASRPMFAATSDHAGFWIHVAVTVVFALLSLAAFARLARLARRQTA